MFTLLAAVALASASPGPNAIAPKGFTKVEGRVSLAGLDLSKSTDVAELEKRIERKARFICRRGVYRELWGSPLVQDCTASVEANGKAQLGALIPANRPLANAEVSN